MNIRNIAIMVGNLEQSELVWVYETAGDYWFLSDHGKTYELYGMSKGSSNIKYCGKITKKYYWTRNNRASFMFLQKVH